MGGRCLQILSAPGNRGDTETGSLGGTMQVNAPKRRVLCRNTLWRPNAILGPAYLNFLLFFRASRKQEAFIGF